MTTVLTKPDSAPSEDTDRPKLPKIDMSHEELNQWLDPVNANDRRQRIMQALELELALEMAYKAWVESDMKARQAEIRKAVETNASEQVLIELNFELIDSEHSLENANGFITTLENAWEATNACLISTDQE